MADFKQAVLKTLVREGGYVNDPTDAGGETYKGISRKFHPDWLGWEIIERYKQGSQFPSILEHDGPLQDLVIKVYTDGYWKNLYSQINDQSLAEKLFDMGVLFGVGTAIKLLQISMTNDIQIVADGSFGPETLNDVNQFGEIAAYRTVLINHCMDVVNRNPDDAKFLHGWLNRIQS